VTAETIRRWRNTRPATPNGLWNWVYAFTGVKIARQAVCNGHHAPFDAFVAKTLERPPIVVHWGSRGSGKSFDEAIALHYLCRFHPGHEACVLGGSKDQSRQIYNALTRHVRKGHGAGGSDGGPDVIRSLLKEKAEYANDSAVSILAASEKSVRGPHVPTLALDEVDEIDEGYRNDAMGMNMAMGGLAASVHMGSTSHRPDGPMTRIVAQAREEGWPLFVCCAFEVLERCPTGRSGGHLEKCPECPLVQWCHEDRIASGDLTRPPKAKISDGHYAIESLIQKIKTTNKRVFEADYLCKGMKADGVWFPEFDPTPGGSHVGDDAEYDPNLPVHVGIDSGNRTGAVWFQVREVGSVHRVTVFADFYSDGQTAEANARAIAEISRTRCNGRMDVIATDPAGKSKTSIGPSVMGEYDRSGLKRVQAWPLTPVVDSLSLLESFVRDAAGTPWLRVHPRCQHLIKAFVAYRRAGKAPQWSDLPLDPQHPAEDMIDALRGGLCHKFPQGRRGEFRGRKVGVGAAVN
jgi:hypothetical protein